MQNISDNTITGYYATKYSFTKTHLVDAFTQLPICGAKCKADQFQWCSMRPDWNYLECKTCRRIMKEHS